MLCPLWSVAPWLYVTGVAMHLEIGEYPNTKRDVYYPPNFRSACEIISGGGACSFNVLVTQQKPNCCFSKQLGYCSCVTILPIECGQFVTNKLANLSLGRVYVLQSIISLCNPRYDA